MFEKIQNGTTTIKFGQSHEEPKENYRLTKIKKDNKPGPQTFEVAKSIDTCTLRS